MSADATVSEGADADDRLPARPARVRWARWGYVVIAGVFGICVAIQVFIAGMAVFVDPANWSIHIGFVNVFAFLPFVMLALAFVGRLPRDLKVLPVVLWVLIAAQYITAGHFGFGYVVAAIHPVNALAIFWLAVATTRRAWTRASGPAGAPS